MTTPHQRTLARAITAALAGSCLNVLTPAQVAMGQDVALEEVVVTAQRREQSLQDVPIAIQVVNEDLINDVEAEDMTDLNGFVPGLVISGDSLTQPRYTIRGIQTGDFGVGTDSAVGVYVDGVYSARTGASLLAFNDIERIEVLKGPQGTLFGRNSAAGAVSIVTRKPADEFDSLLKLRVGDYNKRRVEGMVNVPLAENVALRVNGLWNQSDGWMEDAETGKDLMPEDNWAARAALKWDLSDETSMTVVWNHDSLDQYARPAIGLVTIPEGQAYPTFPADPTAYLNPLRAKVYNDVVSNEESRTLDEANLFVDHDFGWADLHSTTAWRQFDTVNREDEDGTNLIHLYFDTANVEENESWYQEFKLSGQTGALDWVSGISYYSEDAKQASDTHATTNSIDTVFRNFGFFPTPDGTLYGFTSEVLAANGIPLTMLGLPWREVMNNEGKFNATAVFGDVIWHATDRLNVTFGLRYTHDEKEFSWLNGPREAPELDATIAALEAAGFFDNPEWPIPAFYYGLDVVFDFSMQGVEGEKVSKKKSWDDVSPRFVVDYAVTPDVMVFGSLAKGYKAGGYNSVQPLSKFDNEDVWNVEGGVKSLFPDIGLIVNASAFSYVYLEKQSIRLVCGAQQVCQYVVDTSDDEAYGFDVDTRWQPIDALTLTANLSWIDATYKKYITPPPESQDLSGQPTGEPKLSAALGASYVWSFAGFGDLDLSAMYAYRGETRCNGDSQAQGTCQTSPNFETGAATNRTDLRLAWSSERDTWGAAAFVTNVFDDRYVTSVNNITANTFGTPFASISEPRMWGLEVWMGF